MKNIQEPASKSLFQVKTAFDFFLIKKQRTREKKNKKRGGKKKGKKRKDNKFKVNADVPKAT